MDIVIARYNEDVNWLKKIIYDNKINKVYLYNKGLNDIPLSIFYHPKLIYQELENKGRESQTYIYHIINNYDNLNEKTLFTQGDPFDQAPDFFKFIENYIYWLPDYQPISSIWFFEYNVPPKKIYDDYHNNILDAKYLLFEMNLDNLNTISFNDYGIMGIANRLKNNPSFNNIYGNGIIQNITNKYNIPIKKKSSNIGLFHYGGIFGVSRNYIVKHDINVYKRIQKFLDEFGEDAGFVMERLWYMLFTY